MALQKKAKIMTAKQIISDKYHRLLERIVVCLPSGNPTALICADKPLELAAQGLNQALLEHARLEPFQIEQCGYLLPSSQPEITCRLEMLGGEFCGNATRSAIRVWQAARHDDLQRVKDGAGLIEVSGVPYPLQWRVDKQQVMVQMPLALDTEIKPLEDGYLVELEGITHLLSLQNFTDFATEAPQLLEKYQLKDLPAAAISHYDPDSKQAQFCVYIRAVDTIFMESACGSGTASIGLWLYQQAQQKEKYFSITQPSGEAIAVIIDDGKLFISGEVTILFDDSLQL